MDSQNQRVCYPCGEARSTASQPIREHVMRKSRAQRTNVPTPKPSPQPSSNSKPRSKQPYCWYCGDADAKRLTAKPHTQWQAYFCSTRCAAAAGLEAAEELVRWDAKTGDWKVIARADRLATGRKLNRVEQQLAAVEPTVDASNQPPDYARIAVAGFVANLSRNQAVAVLAEVLAAVQAAAKQEGVNHA